MLRELKALLGKYLIAYVRVPKRIFSDVLLAIIISITLVLSKISTLGLFAAFLYVFTMPFTFLTIVRTMLGEIVSEKESGTKEYLKLSGLNSFTYQLYIFIITACKTIFFTIFILIGIYIGEVVESISSQSSYQSSLTMPQTMLLYSLCAVGTISFTMFVSVFFDDSKLATSVGGIAYASISFVSLIVFNSNEEPIYYYLISLFPQAALVVGMLMDPSRVPPTVNIYTMIDTLCFDFFIYLILYSYLDQVLRNENGVRKPIFFFLEPLFKVFKSNKKRNVVSQSVESGSGLSAHLINTKDEQSVGSVGILSPAQIDVSSARHHEVYREAQGARKAVQVSGLRKTFGKFVAVDSISFPIYEGQIFCLLGSNGAGKTSTIKMMTGLLGIDEGDIYYEGESFKNNMKEIRKRVGSCGQQDILFEKVKVHEHLALVARIRGIPEEEIPAMVEETIDRLHLRNERDKYSEQLSGGNKRKLSLAMAVVGRTKVIFLDEPTSGMDPQNKRVMWQHLKQLKKQGLTILLTTHHLDEADELSDRIAIMSRGKVLVLGTSEYLKKNFGTGYHLTLTPDFDRISINDFKSLKKSLWDTICKVIPKAQLDDQTAVDTLKCSLPFAAQKDFPALFEEIESRQTVKIGLEMNTLEDVFVNLTLQEEQEIQEQNGGTVVDFALEPPECLREKPVYNFVGQTISLGKRRAYMMYRSGRNIFLMILPIVLVAFGIVGGIGIGGPYSLLSFFEVVILIAYSLNSATYCSLPVYEREDKLKYMMDVMGLRNIPYWLGNVVVDITAITLMNLAIYGLYIWLYWILMAWTGGVPIPTMTFIDPQQFLIATIPHGFALVTAGYMWSYMFDKSLSAVKYYPLFYFFVLFLLGTFLVSEIQPNNPFWAGVLGIVCPSTIYIEYVATIPTLGLDLEQVVLFELAYAVIYLVITVLIEFRRLRFSSSKKSKKEAAAVSVHGSQIMPVNADDITKEKHRMTESPEDPIKVADLQKTYSNGYTAVHDISFGVEQGQIFGLLGPNGAGKSTTFNILTAAIAKTEGSVQLLNREVNKNMPDLFENVGICPQFNSLWDHLTVKEHLLFYGNLKGLSASNLKAAVEYYLDALYLREHMNKKAMQLSGGNKRKLCVAIAFIGSAYLIFLDEPSSGVDPLARRFLWGLIQKTLKNRKASIVLTTHSMYEAESLAHKIGILINGEFVCVGATHDLKQRYSQGYKITISMNPDAPNPMGKLLQVLPKAERTVDNSYVQQTYHIPAQGFSFSDAFEKLEQLKINGVIKDFSLYNTSLEQIFMQFSKFQINPDGDDLNAELEVEV